MGRILVIHGPNLNMLGTRETGLYGENTLEAIDRMIAAEAAKEGLEAEFFQSNHEGAIIDRVQQADAGGFDCIIINPGAFTHYSIAIRDAIAGIAIPVIEVHITNIYTREEFRHKSVIAPVVVGQISGFGAHSYVVAVRAAAELVE
ncbi:MAG: type II 3-dehydroquinate dehydratase [Actinobacteria bacterium]|nr:type II 3-dehydroquinate dehydratase [Actinomycetota bacterium]